MKNKIIIAFLTICTTLSAQPDTEIYLFDILNTDGKIELSNLNNISKGNKGYDNQPSFYDDNTILFSSTRNGQTDVALYDIQKGTTSWISNTAVGSEYSPLKIPNKEAISSIRLDTNGLQLLYQYDLNSQEPKVLIEDLSVGYHVWYDENTLVSSVTVEDKMDLAISNLKDKTNWTVYKNVGRSLHKIPNTDFVSFISKEDETWMIKSLNLITGTTEDIKSMPSKVEDMCWMADGTILMPSGNTINKFNPKKDKDWSVLHQFKESEISEISRIAISPDKQRLVLVSAVSESPATIVQRQVDTFNAMDLEGFASCYAENVVVQNFPNDTTFIGNDNLKSSYKSYFANNKAKVEVLKRIVVGNNVIDEEKGIINGKEYNQVAIYQIEKGKITSMTFIHPKKTAEKVEAIVEEQLDAYNRRDINAFSKTYADDIQVFDFPHKLRFEGQKELNKVFIRLFSSTPDLNCEIKNRILIGNISIDEEYLNMNGNNFSVVAIYEIEEEKIKRVTFLR